jgi:hypothetical protein
MRRDGGEMRRDGGESVGVSSYLLLALAAHIALYQQRTPEVLQPQ